MSKRSIVGFGLMIISVASFGFSGEISTPWLPEASPNSETTAYVKSGIMLDHAVDVFKWNDTIQGLDAAYARAGRLPKEGRQKRKEPMRRLVFHDTNFHSEIWRLNDDPLSKYLPIVGSWHPEGSRYIGCRSGILDLTNMEIIVPPAPYGGLFYPFRRAKDCFFGRQGGLIYTWNITTDKVREYPGLPFNLPATTYDDKYIVGNLPPQDSASLLFVDIDTGKTTQIDTPAHHWHGVFALNPSDWENKNRELTPEEKSGYLLQGDHEQTWPIFVPKDGQIKFVSEFWSKQFPEILISGRSHSNFFSPGYIVTGEGFYFELPSWNRNWQQVPQLFNPLYMGESYNSIFSDHRWMFRMSGLSDYDFLAGCPYAGTIKERKKPEKVIFWREGMLTRLDGSGASERLCSMGATQITKEIPINQIGIVGGYSELSPIETFSPDGTKIAYNTGIMDQNQRYIVVVKHPAPPKNLKIDKDEINVTLKWSPADMSKETCGYFIYRSNHSGRDWQRCNSTPVTDYSYTEKTPAQPSYYIVTSFDVSGLESVIGSNEVPLDPSQKIFHFYQAAEHQTEIRQYKYPIIEGRDPRVRGEYYLMLCGNEPSDYKLALEVPRKDKYSVWALVAGRKEADNNFLKPFQTETQSYNIKTIISGNSSSVTLNQENWHWNCIGKSVSLDKGKAPVKITLSGDGVKINTIVLTDDLGIIPQGDYKIVADPPERVINVLVENSSRFSQTVRWNPVKNDDLDHYNIYAGTAEDVEPKQSFLIGSPRTTSWEDLGLQPGTKYHYIVTAVDRAGNESAVSKIADGITSSYTPFNAVLKATDLKGEKDLKCGNMDAVKGCTGKSYIRLNEDRKVEFKKSLTVPETGQYALWIRASALKPEKAVGAFANASGKLFIKEDGKDIHGSAREICSNRYSFDNKEGYGFYWSAIEMYASATIINLNKGEHEYTFIFDAKSSKKPLAIDLIMVTNNLSFRPGPNWVGKGNNDGK